VERNVVENKKYVFVWCPDPGVWGWVPRDWRGDEPWDAAAFAPADRTDWRGRVVDETELWLRENDPLYDQLRPSWDRWWPKMQRFGLDPGFDRFDYARNEGVYERQGIEIAPDGRRRMVGPPAWVPPGRPRKGTTKINAGHVALTLRLLFDQAGLRLEDALRKRGPGKPPRELRPAKSTLKVGVYLVDGFGAPRQAIRTVTSLSSSQTTLFISSASTDFSQVRPLFAGGNRGEAPNRNAGVVSPPAPAPPLVSKEDDVTEVLQELRVIGRDVAQIKSDMAKLMELPEITKRIAERLRLTGYTDEDISKIVDEFIAAARP
jgi:hypothetical protein